MSKKEYNLVWGESVCVRQAFLDQTLGIPIRFGLNELSAMDYTPFSGDARLIEETAKVILRQTGLAYKHIFITNGATGGCTIALRAYSRLAGYVGAITNSAPYFPLYPAMISASGLKHITLEAEMDKGWKHVVLLDTPANPSGKMADVPTWAATRPVIFDSVYNNNVYMSLKTPSPEHDVLVGSYSKLTGLNGIRLGWIATNNNVLAIKIGDLVAGEYCGLSKPSKMILMQMIDQFNVDPDHMWGEFERNARYALDSNRTEWAKLERFFDGTPVPVNGMFYYAGMDASAKALFEKAGVLWQVGSKCGTSDDYGRFNIGQDNKVVLAAVKSVLKADRIA